MVENIELFALCKSANLAKLNGKSLPINYLIGRKFDLNNWVRCWCMAYTCFNLFKSFNGVYCVVIGFE